LKHELIKLNYLIQPFAWNPFLVANHAKIKVISFRLLPPSLLRRPWICSKPLPQRCAVPQPTGIYDFAARCFVMPSGRTRALLHDLQV